MEKTANDTRASLKAEMRCFKLSLRNVSLATDIPASSLSKWLNGLYRGKNRRISEGISAFLKRREELRRVPGKVKEFVKTSTALRVLETARICHLDAEIGVCYGPAGIGKTEAAKEYARQNPDVILIEADLGHTARVLFSELHRKVGYDGFGTVHAMFTDVVERLKDSGRLVIVDEAENLPYRALELLRRVYDKAGVGILLIGMPRLIANLRGRRGEYAQLYSRVGIATRLNTLRPEDTKLLVQALIPQVDSLGPVYHETSQGNTRTLCKLISRSARVAEINDTTLTPEVVRETAKMLII